MTDFSSLELSEKKGKCNDHSWSIFIVTEYDERIHTIQVHTFGLRGARTHQEPNLNQDIRSYYCKTE